MTQTSKIKRRGMLLVLSSPSGAGKTTLARRLLEAESDMILSISCTTRTRRPNEMENKDYQFITTKKFNEMKKRDEFFEWAEVFGNFYGTPKKPVEKALAKGQDVVFDIDWQGARQLKRVAREDVVSVFILPPSAPELKRRLTTRAADSEEVVAYRMSKATKEIAQYKEYNYVIINEDVKQSLTQIRTIVASERLKRLRQENLPDFVQKLRSKL